MKQYLELVKHIKDNGSYKEDRTGTGTYSVFGYQMRFDLSEGFPLVTTKKTHLKSIIHELLWFLSGDTNIRYLKANGVSIWDEWVKEGTAEYRELTDDEVVAELCKKLGAKTIGGIAWQDNDSPACPPNPDNKSVVHRVFDNGDVVFWVKKADYDAFFSGRPLTDAALRRIATTYNIECTRLVAGELGPVYGSQWRSWPDVRQSSKVVNLTIAERCEEANQYGDYYLRLGKAYSHPSGEERRKALETLSSELDAMGIPKERRIPSVNARSIDQISNLIETLKKNPDSRRLIVSAWNPAEVDQMALPPCHCLFQFYTVPLTWNERWHLAKAAGHDIDVMRGHKEADVMAFMDQLHVPARRLSCQLLQRSADVGLGVPFNIASYALLLMMVAQVVNMVPGEFIWTGGDCHIYSNHVEQVNLQLTRNPHPLPKMIIRDRGQGIDDFVYEDFELVDYVCHPHIAMPISV